MLVKLTLFFLFRIFFSTFFFSAPFAGTAPGRRPFRQSPSRSRRDGEGLSAKSHLGLGRFHGGLGGIGGRPEGTRPMRTSPICPCPISRTASSATFLSSDRDSPRSSWLWAQWSEKALLHRSRPAKFINGWDSLTPSSPPGNAVPAQAVRLRYY